MALSQPIRSNLTSIGLLALRLGAGLTMLFGHGWPKYVARADEASTFPAIMPGGPELNFWLVVFAEALCAGLLAIGLLTRLAAIPLIVTMGVAFFVVHKGLIFGENGGELPLLYGAAFLTIFFTGPGSISLDNFLFSNKKKPASD